MVINNNKYLDMFICDYVWLIIENNIYDEFNVWICYFFVW